MKLGLRGRLLLSHLLPLILLIPLVGLALIYLLETRIFIPTLANEMTNQGLLVAQLSEADPKVWSDPARAQQFIDSLSFQRPTRIGLLSPSQVLLATSRPDDRSLVGTVIQSLSNSTTAENPYAWGITPGNAPNEQILEVVIPVKNANGQLLGLIRMYRRLTDIEQGLSGMRLLILAVLLVGLLLTGTVAVLLAESFSNPLRRLAGMISRIPMEGEATPLPEEGLEEVQAITHATNQLQERRQELEATRQQMLSNLIHELGRPLGSIRTAVHALQAGAADQPELRANLFKGMTERIDRMGRLLDDLSLTYRSIRPSELDLRPTDLCDWLATLVPLWEQTALQKGLHWSATISPNLPLITTDPDRLAQALSNLVNNAIKFTPAGQSVTLTVSQNGEEIVLEVLDTGPGIAVEDQPHLFTPFFRSVHPDWKAPGLGLGLSIARSLVQSLGGEITLVSHPDQGSSFTIHLPFR